MSDTEKDLQAKTFDSFEIKDVEKGEVEAIVATLDIVDKDQEVIRVGAIPPGSKVKLSEWGHNSVGLGFGAARLPVGKGVIVVEGNKAIFRGRFFLNTTRGMEAFRTIKEMGTDQQWSFGYRVRGTEVPDEDWRKKGAIRILTKLEPFEVSPVAIGAGVGTRTVAAKCEGCGQPQEGETCASCAAKAAAEANAAAAKAAAELAQRAQAEFAHFQETRQRRSG